MLSSPTMRNLSSAKARVSIDSYICFRSLTFNLRAGNYVMTLIINHGVPLTLGNVIPTVANNATGFSGVEGDALQGSHKDERL
jgi:hypothetical protein